MTPQAIKCFFQNQIVDYTKPQLLAGWKELNLGGYEPAAASKKDLERFFIERFDDYHEGRREDNIANSCRAHGQFVADCTKDRTD